MSPHFECSSCGAHWYSSVSEGAPCPACGGPLAAQVEAEVQTFIADVSAPETTIEEVRAALGELEEASQTRVQILVAEILAQSGAQANGESVSWLRTLMTPALIRIEAGGPALRASSAGGRDPLAEWGAFIMERVADRWGLDEAEGNEMVWFEVDRRRSAD
jgi:hypothetical protein